MIGAQLAITAWLIAALQSPVEPETISGVVVNGSSANTPVAGAEVVLRMQRDGVFEPFATTTTDAQGAFQFDGLPAGGRGVFLPGANRDGVHFPGRRVRLGGGAPHARVRLVVYDAIEEPCPLVVVRHEVVLRPGEGVLNVTESMLVRNPSSASYIGLASKGMRVVTLRLGIPSDFMKVTFHDEFYGRRFMLIDGALLTSIPWPPGDRELAFHYVVPITERRTVWERPLDLPSELVRVRVITEKPEAVRCNLPALATNRPGELAFASGAGPLSKGEQLRVELGRMAVPFTAYAKWLAVLVLVVLVLAVSAVMRLRRDGGSVIKEAAPSPLWRSKRRGIHPERRRRQRSLR